MRSFQRSETVDPVPGDVVGTLGRIDRAAGAEARHRDQLPRLLEALREQARIESITASSAIEGVVVETARVPKLVSDLPQRFRSRSEAEFAGYRAALDYLLHDDPGPLTAGLVLHLHRLLFSFSDVRGGSFKTDDNLVVNRSADGAGTVLFEPVSARETPHFIEELVVRTREALITSKTHPLIVASAFVLDFLCIHPFADGNGRVGRLLTTYLLGLGDYDVVRYVSLEQLVFETKDGYYHALSTSTKGWFDDGRHDLWPWARYLLSRLGEAYERLEARVAAGASGGTKQDRVRDFVLLHAPSTFVIADIRKALPGVSDNTIRLVLGQLKAAQRISSDGLGRSAKWRRRSQPGPSKLVAR